MRVKVAELAQEGNVEFENIVNNFRDEFTQMEPGILCFWDLEFANI